MAAFKKGIFIPQRDIFERGVQWVFD